MDCTIDPTAASTDLTQAVDRLQCVAHVIFDVPAVDELATVYGIGLTLPLMLYLVAHAVGKLVNFFGK